VTKLGRVTYALVYADEGTTKKHKLSNGVVVLGRAPSCDVVLNHFSVSRRHAQLSVTDAGCVVKDLGSRNGTYVNGQQVQEAELRDGDRLLIGQFPTALRGGAMEGVVVTSDDALTNLGQVIQRPMSPRNFEAAGGMALDGARLLKLLADVGRTLVGTQPIDEVLNHVLDLAIESTQAKRALLLLYDEATRQLVPRFARHRGLATGSTLISRAILEQVLNQRISILAMNAQADPRLGHSQSIKALDIRSLMCAPLWHEAEIIGILYVDNPQSDQFTIADLDLFTAFSNYAAVAIAQARLTARVREETRRRERLERYHSPAVVDRILNGATEVDAPFIAQERDLTVLFADIVGFTAIAEGRPQEVAVLLNAFFTRMADAIFEHEGTLDKFIGDSVLAVFGAPLELPNHALSAVRSAQSMGRALKALNEERPDQALQMRIAIHTGVALVGDIGSPKRRDYTVLGDVVNTAARIEQSIAGPGQIVITRATRDRLGGQVKTRSLGEVQLRGRTERVEVFEIAAD
jgi:adenylate cyclase